MCFPNPRRYDWYIFFLFMVEGENLRKLNDHLLKVGGFLFAAGFSGI